MSLLLDALRRASARRDDPLAERLDVGRHAPAGDEGAATVPPAPDDAESSTAQSGGARSEDELALVPEADERPAPERHSGDGAQPAGATGASQAQSGQRERAAAAALLHAGAGGGRGRGTQLLGLTLAVLVVSAALAGGGWLWYMQSRQDIDTALGGYRPEPAQAELAANAAADSGSPRLAPQAADTPAQDAQSTPTASDSSADASAEPAPADSSAASSSVDAGSGDAAPAASSAAQDAGESDAQGDDASATVEATDNRPPAEPEEQLAQAAAQLAGGAPATDGAASAEPGAAQGNTAGGGDAAASGSETASRGDAADAGSGSAPAERARDLVETSGQRQSPATPSAAAQPPRPMIRQADSAPLEKALKTGYGALGAGDLAAAERAYARARRLAPDNRDALLGAAAVRQHQGDAEAARRLYQQVLDAYPRDPHAQAALAALDAGATRRNESTLKTLLRDNPNAPALHYALGNVYATESRWSEARMAYARAARIAPDDPDYAYNLAVALDHLGRREAARRAYAQALSLASGAAADFDPAAVQRRLQQLR